ncbi:CWF19-like protein 2 homolog isoform X2 [Stegodyphus dumicola]|uniref:CWF19-like protein 2 homolog isoform X2 n=1 Tax=Stegodyphus dumicola TaxID=202533 RepID=UPI0015AB3895|nr:CWF19-like protein 2 homolog isoform X2 [Stegodyphus dumicola]
MEWVEAEAPSTEVALATVKDKREDWMNEEDFVSTVSKEDMKSGSSRMRKKEIDDEKRAQEKKIQDQRELNPYWKNNGKGLPEEETNASNSSLPSTSVGDGGYSWLKKAYLRIKERAQEEGRSMEEIAVERWGSLDKLLSMIKEAESRLKSNSSKYSDSYERRHEDGNKDTRNVKFRAPSDDKSNQSSSPERSMKYQKPKHDSKSRHKSNYFSSSRSSKTDKVRSDSVERTKYSSHNSFNRNSEERFQEERIISSDRPAWKKPGYGNEASKERKRHDGNAEKKEIKYSSGREPHQPVWKKPKSANETYSSYQREQVPAWKKPKPVTETDSPSREPQIPTLMKPKSLDETEALKKKKNYESEEMARCENSPQSDDRPVTYTDDDLNHLAANYLRAELNGDLVTASKFKKQLEEARHLVANNTNKCVRAKRQVEVMLTKLDSRGFARPVRLSHQEYPKFKDKKSNKYFDDTSKYSLKQMFERERLTTTEDNLEMFLDVAAECKEDSEVDNEQGYVSKKVTQKMDHSRQEERDIGKAIRQHQRLNAALEKCEYCLDQPSMKRYVLVDIRDQIYLCLPSYQSLVENHCLIVPKQHVSSFLALDEDVWTEVEHMKYQLRKWFRTQEKNVIFIETSMNFRYCPHAVLECIPVPEEEGDMAPFYFKKAIQESEVEWAHNQKLVDLTKKGLRRSIPKGLPYFYVEFDKSVHAGYAHVIEDEKQFPRNFGKEIIGGMLDIDSNILRKNKKEDALKKSSEVAKFEKLWNEFVSKNM